MIRRWFTVEECARAKRLRDGGYTLEEIAVRLGSTKSTIGKLAARGFKRHVDKRKPRPGDLSLRAHELTFVELKRHYKVGANTLYAWFEEGGIRPPKRHRAAPVREMPEDFPWVAIGKSCEELEQHYRAARRTITRWKLESGVPAPRAELMRARRSRQQQAESRVGWADRYYAEKRA